MPHNFPENDDNDELILSQQEIPFLAVNFVEEMDGLVSLAHYGPSIVLITGDDGIGKSVIVEQLDSETSDLGVIRIDGTPMLGVDQLHASFLQQLNSYDQAVEFNAVRDTLLKAAVETEQLILVDDAQQLSPSVLETLLSLVAPVEQSPTNLVRLFLFGNSDLEEQINTSSFPQAAVYHLQLKGLNKDEIGPFLGHILNLSDASVEENYGKKYLNSLWKSSRGNPSLLIQDLSQEDSEAEFIDGVEREDGGSHWPGIIFRIILTILGIGLLVLAIFGEKWLSSGDKNSAEEATPILIPYTVIEQLPTVAEKPIEPVEELAIEKFPEEKPLVSIELEAVAEKTAAEDVAVNNEAINPEENTEIETAKEIIAEQAQQTDTQTESLSTESLPTVQELIEKVEKEIAAIEAAPEATVPAVVSTPQSDYSADEHQLLDVSATHYSIQLVGLSKLEDLQTFAKTLAPKQPTYIYRSLLNQQSWYILVTGNYKDADTARNARDQLQPSMQKLKPWIKSFSVIQQQIRDANKN